MKHSFLALLLLTPLPAHADCGDSAELLFSCSFNGGSKQVTTCLADDIVSYAFGPVGAVPELAMVREVQDVDMRPWNGFGRYINESFTLTNGAYGYTLRYAIDKLAQEGADGLDGELWVTKDMQEIATMQCDPGSLAFSGYPFPLYDAKLATGQIWDRETETWMSD